MAIEYREPRRSEYDSDLEYQTALIQATIDYRKAQFRAIDRSFEKRGANGHGEERKDKPTSRDRPKPTVHDFLQDRPSLLRRYREIGPMALLELD